ncbi:protein RoBo-1-like isoform X2 [Marmota flaviventris]|uniref:protein RoBo-1-like isoform X2 n=1 Tax=Marmota flaviventris TaxID=93162 RepID=UPI003A83E992
MATVRSLCQCPMQQCPGVSMVTSVQASTLRSLSTLCIFVALVFSTVESYTCMKCMGAKCKNDQGTCETSQSCFHFQQLYTSPVSPVSKEENGVVCPACFSENGMICIPQPLKCTGAETKCLEIKGLTGGNPPSIVSAMGCATESACKLGTIELNYELEFDCVKPISGSPLLTPIISSTLTSLLLLKVLL